MSGARIGWRVEVGDGVESFEAEWRSLAGPRNSTPFQSPGLMRSFYRRLAADGSAEPLVALVRRPDGRPAALFAMSRSRHHGLTWLRTDARPIDYAAPILDPSLRPGEVRDIVRAVLAAVPGADLLYCNKMPAAFEDAPDLLVGLPNAARLRLSAWVLRLAGRTREDVLAAQHTKFRGHLRRATQKLTRTHRRTFSFALGDEIDDDAFAAFRALRSRSAEEKGRSNILDDPRWTDLYLDLRAGRAAPCLAWLSRLEADGEVIAVLFGVTDGRRAVAIMPASRLDEWRPYAPGLQLMEETILHFRDNGIAFFDLSVGDMDYKRRIGCDEVALYDALFPGTVLGWIYYAAWKVKIMIRNRMKPIAAD
jgi:CelD/BcsL family acetyltransferase involved in cellulose biosynthesis